MNIKNGTYKVVIENDNEYWFDTNGNMIHYKSSNGEEYWYDSNRNEITKEEFDRIHKPYHGRIVIIEWKSYQLQEIK